MPPGASRGDTERGLDNFFLRQNTPEKLCELCCGRDGQGRTNYMYRTMHILDVVSSVSRSSKCTKIVSSWGFATDPVAGFKEAYF